MKRSTDARLTHIEDMIQIIHDHLMDLHRIAEAALIAETTDTDFQPAALILAVMPHPPTVN